MEMNKIKVELNDVRYLESKLKTSGKELVESSLADNNLGLRHQRNLVQQEMNEWIDDIFATLQHNLEFTDVDVTDGQALVGLSEPVDERLKQKVAAKEAELNNIINKTVEARANNPATFSSLAKDLNMATSQYTEDLQINPPPSPSPQDIQESIDDIKETYTNAMDILSNLKQELPIQLNKVGTYNEIKRLRALQ